MYKQGEKTFCNELTKQVIQHAALHILSSQYQ